MIKIETSSKLEEIRARLWRNEECLVDIKYNSQLTFLWLLEFAHYVAEENAENVIKATFTFSSSISSSDDTAKISYAIPVHILCDNLNPSTYKMLSLDNLAHAMNILIKSLPETEEWQEEFEINGK